MFINETFTVENAATKMDPNCHGNQRDLVVKVFITNPPKNKADIYY